jgi:preprotein translocase subunit SecD
VNWRATRSTLILAFRIISTVILIVALMMTLMPVSTTRAQTLRLEVAQASAGVDEKSGTPLVSIRLKGESAKAWADLTRANVGRKAEFRINDKAVFAPIIREPMFREFFVIPDKDFTADGARALAQQLSDPDAVVDVEILQK